MVITEEFVQTKVTPWDILSLHLFPGFHDGSEPLMLTTETVAGIQHKGGKAWKFEG